MSESATKDFDIAIPMDNDDDIVSVRLVEDGAVHIAYGIAIFVSNNPVTPHVAPFPNSMPGEIFSLAKGKALRGLMIDCFGRVFLAGDDTVKLHCDFLVDDNVIVSSGELVIKLSASNASREFHLRCHFA
jgi:hypothetical protein